MPILGDIFGYLGAGSASKKAQEGYLNAMHGVLGATQTGQDIVSGAGAAAPGMVNTAVEAGNKTLADTAAGLKQNIQPYLVTGARGTDLLNTQAPFSFNDADWANDPSFKFEMEQGTNAINNAASSRGLLQSGNTLKDLTRFGQGLASTYYNDAFQRALQGFGANLTQGRTLADIGLRGSGQLAATEQNAGNQIARNTIGAGYYGAQTPIDVAQFLANFGQRGATIAGDYATGKGNVAAAGNLAKSRALGGIGDSILGAVTGAFLPGGIDIGYLTGRPSLGTIGG